MVCRLATWSPINKNKAKEAFSHDDNPSNEIDYSNDDYLTNDNNIAVTTMSSLWNLVKSAG
jgi:hypothetical protein